MGTVQIDALQDQGGFAASVRDVENHDSIIVGNVFAEKFTVHRVGQHDGFNGDGLLHGGSDLHGQVDTRSALTVGQHGGGGGRQT